MVKDSRQIQQIDGTANAKHGCQCELKVERLSLSFEPNSQSDFRLPWRAFGAFRASPSSWNSIRFEIFVVIEQASLYPTSEKRANGQLSQHESNDENDGRRGCGNEEQRHRPRVAVLNRGWNIWCVCGLDLAGLPNWYSDRKIVRKCVLAAITSSKVQSLTRKMQKSVVQRMQFTTWFKTEKYVTV